MNKKLACMYNEDFIEKRGKWKCEIYEIKYENKYYYSAERQSGELIVVNKEKIRTYAQWMEERDNGDKGIYWVMLEDKGLKEWEKEYEREVTKKKWDKEEKRLRDGLGLCENRIKELEKCKEEIEERLEVERMCMENMQKKLMEIKKIKGELEEMGQNKSE